MCYHFFKVVNKLIRKGHLPRKQIRDFLGRLMSKHIDVVDRPIHLQDINDVDLSPLYTITPPSRKSCICCNMVDDNPEYDLQIIIPVYKVEQYVESCMDSVVRQKTKYKFLVVVVNDGSPDHSREKLKRYETFPNVTIIDQDNKGFAGARNAGLKHIRARYVMFVDSDDLLLPGAVENLMNAAVQCTADVVEGGMRTLWNGKMETSVTHPIAEQNKWVGILTGFPVAKVIRSKLMRHLCFPEGYWFEDTIVSMMLYPQCNNIMTISDEVYLYRINPNGISATSGGKIKCIDSLYITLQMLEDASCLNIARGQQQYDHFFNQVRINQRRISTLRNNAVNRCVFNITCRACHQYFFGMSASDDKQKKLEHALQTHDFGLYMVECMI